MSSKNMFSEKRNFRFGYHCVKSVFIWRFSGRYFPAFSLNAGKYRPEKLRIRTLFMQCIFKKANRRKFCTELTFNWNHVQPLWYHFPLKCRCNNFVRVTRDLNDELRN